MNENTPNPGNREYTLGDRITGWARPQTKKYTPNLAKRQTILGTENGKFSSILAITIKPPTQQFTSPACNLQVSNGNGSAFQRIDGPQALRVLAHELLVWADELEPIWMGAVAEGTRLETIQREVENRANMFKELIEQMGQEPSQPEWTPQEQYEAP